MKKDSSVALVFVALVLLLLFVGKARAATKYKIGDVLYNPPDSQDTFTILGTSQVQGGPLQYVFKQNQSGVIFYVDVSIVDNSSAWAKL